MTPGQHVLPRAGKIGYETARVIHADYEASREGYAVVAERWGVGHNAVRAAFLRYRLAIRPRGWARGRKRGATNGLNFHHKAAHV